MHLRLFFLLLLPLAIRAAEPARSNILVIVSDDHGYADVGFNGGKDIPTPQLDRPAQRDDLQQRLRHAPVLQSHASRPHD